MRLCRLRFPGTANGTLRIGMECHPCYLDLLVTPAPRLIFQLFLLPANVARKAASYAP
jgi:hypothetical protein